MRSYCSTPYCWRRVDQGKRVPSYGSDWWVGPSSLRLSFILIVPEFFLLTFTSCWSTISLIIPGYWSGVSEEYSCAGTLISPLYILTAAHCSSSGRLGKAKFAKVGDVRRQSNNPNTYKYNIIEIINHPQYTKKMNDHDIALFKVDKTVTFNDYVIPACLPTADDSTDHVIATGWGTTGFGEAAANDLLKVVLDVFQQPDCQLNYQMESRLSNGIDYERVLCAGSFNESKDTCSVIFSRLFWGFLSRIEDSFILGWFWWAGSDLQHRCLLHVHGCGSDLVRIFFLWHHWSTWCLHSRLPLSQLDRRNCVELKS